VEGAVEALFRRAGVTRADSLEELLDEFDRSWPTLQVGDGWIGRREYDRVRQMVERLGRWLDRWAARVVAYVGLMTDDPNEVLEFATGPGFFKVELDNAIALVDDAVDVKEIDDARAQEQLAAGGIRRARDEFGGESILPYSYAGTQGLVQGNLMSQRVMNALGASELVRTICERVIVMDAGEMKGGRYLRGQTARNDPPAHRNGKPERLSAREG
jgi:hypothetical protein